MRKALGVMLAFGLVVASANTGYAYWDSRWGSYGGGYNNQDTKESSITLTLSKPIETIELKGLAELIKPDTLIDDPTAYGGKRWKYSGFTLRGDLPPLEEYRVPITFGRPYQHYRLIWHESPCLFKIENTCVAVTIYAWIPAEEVNQYLAGKKNAVVTLYGDHDSPGAVFPYHSLRIEIYPQSDPKPSLLK